MPGLGAVKSMTPVKAGAAALPMLSATTDPPTVMRFLLVEDEALPGDGSEAGLAQMGFEVDRVCDGVAALHAVGAGGYAAGILDLALPRPAGSCGRILVAPGLPSASGPVAMQLVHSRRSD